MKEATLPKPGPLHVCSLFLLTTGISVFSLCFANATWAAAATCETVHKSLAEGKHVQTQDVDSINLELLEDKTNPFKHFVAAEMLVSVGFQSLAQAQFEEADRLQKDFVKTQFRQELQANHHSVKYVYAYLREKCPDDPALVFYLARRHLAEISLKRDPMHVSLQPIILELRAASAAPNPYPGTLSLLSMLEYREALNSALKWDRESLLQQSLNHAREELKQNPNSSLAQKVELMCILKNGCESNKLEQVFLHVLKALPLDPEVNILLGRMYLDKKSYKYAIQPVLIGLLTDHDSLTRKDSLKQIYELARNANTADLLTAINKLLADPSWNTDKKIMLCLTVADLLAIAGKPENSLELLALASKGCPPSALPFLELRTGQVLTLMHRYDEAYYYLNKASQTHHLNPAFAQRIALILDRIELVRDNYHRDIATQIKTLILPKFHGNQLLYQVTN